MRLLILLLLFIFGWTTNAQSAVSSLVADTSSGLIYESKNASARQYPASLTKVMTLYLTFNALENGLLKMDDMLPISAHAAKQPRSKMFLKRGDTIRVKDAIMALIIKSANDAAVVLAEALAPSEADFAKMMTEVAHKLGLKNTQFRNASGLHHPQQVTTARDMAVLTIALINHFPQYYKLFSRENFWYRGKEYKTHNRVTQKYAGAEGLKTGYVAAVGYNIISTAKRKNNRLVSVVIGQKTGAIRDKQVMGLLDRGFTATQKPRSVLQKLKKQGKYASLNNTVQKPNMAKYLSIMRKRLASTKKQSDNIAKTRIDTLSKPKPIVNQAKAPVIEEIEQGDNTQDESETPSIEVNQAEIPVEAPRHDVNQPVITQTPAITEAPTVTQTPAITEAPTVTETSTVTQTPTVTETPMITETSTVTETSAKTTETTPLSETSEPKKNKPGKWGIQVGAFSNMKHAKTQAEKAQRYGHFDHTVVKVTQNNKIYRARIYGFQSNKQAAEACRKLKAKNIQCLPIL